MGSMAFSLGHIPGDWDGIKGTDGVLWRNALASTLAALPTAEPRPLGFPIAGYLELHIEQGPSLEKGNIPVGIVTGIQGTRWLEITVRGQAAHAGTTQLAFRRDPMMAANAALHSLYTSIMPGDENARFTVGRITAHPGSVNAIPSSVSLTVDLRHPDVDRLDAVEAQVLASFQSYAAQNGCELEIRKTFDMSPAQFSKPLIEAVERAASHLGLEARHMVSGVFHDALYVARIAPAAMIFVPCRDGLSHNEAEYVEPRHAAAGAQMLLQTVQDIVCTPA